MESRNDCLYPSTSVASSKNCNIINSAEQDSTPSIINSTHSDPLPSENLPNALTPLSDSSSSSRQCRICLLTTETKRKPLISPCHCSGTVRHVHIHCLTHWIEVSSRKAACVNSTRYTKPLPPHCELCGFRYRRRPFVDVSTPNTGGPLFIRYTQYLVHSSASGGYGGWTVVGWKLRKLYRLCKITSL